MPALIYAGLSYWLTPYLNQEVHEVGEGDLLPEWLDCSGLRNPACVQSDDDHKPTLRVDDGSRGLWAVEFNGDPEGGDEFMLVGPDMDTFFPNNPRSMYVAFKPQDVSSLQYMVTDATGSFALTVDNNQLMAKNGSDTLHVGPQYDNINGVLVPGTWYVGIIIVGAGGQLFASVDDPITLRQVASSPTPNLSTINIGARSASFNDPCLNGLRIGEVLIFDHFHPESSRATVMNYMGANWLERGDPLEQGREPASRRFVYFGQNRLKAQVDLPQEFMDRELLDAIHVAHPLGADPLAEGVGWPVADSRPMRLTATSEDMDRQVIVADLADMRIAQSLWNACDNLRSGDPRREGQAVIARCARNFSRVTPGWAKQPGGIVIQALAMSELLEDEGVVCEAFSSQQLGRSSAISGLTGLTTSGEGVNGSDISIGTALPMLFDPTISTQSWDFLAGTPHAADMYIQQPTLTSIPANSFYGVSLDHLTVISGAAGPLAWQLQRSVDSFYWNNATQGWQAGVVWNNCADTVDDETITRAYFGGIDTGGSVTDLTFRYGFPNGATSGRRSRVYHAQMEIGTAFPGSRIVNDSNFPVDRSETRLWFYNGSSQIAKPFNNDCGTFLCRFKPLWTTAEAAIDANSDFHMFVARHSTDPVAAGLPNCYRLMYEATTGLFKMIAHDGTTQTTASKSHTVTRLTEVKVAGRWISLTRDQVGQEAGTISCFVNGVKGTDAIRSSNPTVSLDSQIWAGNSPRGRQICGWLREWRVLPEPLSDTEIFRWSQE